MIPWLMSVAFATTLTVPADTRVSYRLDPVECSPHAEGLKRCHFDGGWVRLIRGGGRVEVWLAPEWDVEITQDGVRGALGAEEVRAQREVGEWTMAQTPGTLREARKLLARLRRRIRTSEVGPEVKARMMDYGAARFATTFAARTHPTDIFEDEDFYRDVSKALGFRDEMIGMPEFWSFGWLYGRMGGGVKALGVDAAVQRMIAQTDALGLHPAMAGVFDWAAESMQSAEELEALEGALLQWEALDPPRDVYDAAVANVRKEAATVRGRPAPALTATDLDGRERQLSELEGPVVIDFWGTWCGPCVAAIPRVKALQERHGDRVTFLALASEKAAGGPRWKATVSRHDWLEGFQHWMHEDSALTERWTISHWPTYVVLDAEHRVVAYVGSTEEVEEILTAPAP